jgi:hypothetical protein
MPLALVILLSLLAGVIFASLSGAVKILKLRYRIRQLEAQLSQLITAQGGTGATPPPPPRAPQGPPLPQ